MNHAHEMSAASVEGMPRPKKMPLRIALLGGRVLCTACLRNMLRDYDDEFDTVEAASDLELLSQRGVHLALLTLLSPQAASLSAVGETVEALGDVPLVVLIDRGEPQFVSQLLALGARGVLTFDLDVPRVTAALRLVDAGGIYVPPQPAADTSPDAPRAPDPATRGRLDRLSPRERAVLDLLRRSLSNREIAETLGIAEATVKIHVRNLLRKTQARNRVELALLAARSSF